MAQQPRFKPKMFAPQEALDALHEDFHRAMAAVDGALEQFNTTQAIFEKALVAVMQDSEAMSDVLVSAGLLEPEDAEVEDSPDDANLVARWSGADNDEDDGGREPQPEFTERQEGDVSLDGTSEEESPAARSRRLGDARERRDAARAAAREAAVRAAEMANESDPIEAETDPNSISGIPEEGIVVDAGRDPFTGELLDG